MRLATSGIPIGLRSAVVGVLTTTPLPPALRKNRILIAGSTASLEDTKGYAAVVSGLELPESLACPALARLRHTDHVKEGYIVALEPESGFMRTLYRPESRHNAIFITQRCNSNCLMCSQPPRDFDDSEHLTKRNLRLLDLIEPKPSYLGITGGEPTLLGPNLFAILKKLKDDFISTDVHMLTNGRRFAWADFTAAFVDVSSARLSLGIPLYSDYAPDHDYVVQAAGAFDQTIMGLHQLARWNQRIEIRVVLHRQTIRRLPNLAEYVYRNLTFVEHVALMGLENIGYAPRNMSELWIDPWEYQDILEETVNALSWRGMNVSIYNHQLCVLPASIRAFAKQSISDWKNIYLPECDNCVERPNCGGFFQWADKLHSSHISPILR